MQGDASVKAGYGSDVKDLFGHSLTMDVRYVTCTDEDVKFGPRESPLKTFDDMKAHLWYSTFTPSKLSTALYLISTDPPDSKAEEDALNHLRKASKAQDYQSLSNVLLTLTEQVSLEV